MPYQHPGGSALLEEHAGRDVGPAFDVFAHSPTAHALMVREFLVFDGVKHFGSAGRLPACLGRLARRRRGTLYKPGFDGAQPLGAGGLLQPLVYVGIGGLVLGGFVASLLLRAGA